MMGFLSRLKKKTAKVLAGRVGSVMETITVGFVQPFKTIKAIVGEGTVKEVRKEFMDKPLGEQLTGVALSTAGYIGAGKIASVIKSKGLASTIAKAVPKTTKGKFIAGAIGVPLASSIIQTPESTLGKIASVPTELAEFGGGVGKFISEPSLETAKELFKGSPLITTGLGLIGASTIAKGVIPALGQVATAKILTGGKVPPATGGGVPVATPTTSPVLLPARQTVTTTTKRRSYKTKPKKTSISQRVNINIGRNIKNKTIRYNKKR